MVRPIVLRLMPLLLLAACDPPRGGPQIHHSLDGFLAPYDLAMAATTTTGGTSGGGTTSGGTTGGGTTSGGTTGGGTSGGSTTGGNPDLASTTGGSAGSGLDPDLVPAGSAGMPCTMPRSESECSGIQVCRFYN